MRTFAVILAGAIVVLVLSCGSSSTTGPSEPADYFPVAIGNAWYMQVEGQMVAGPDTTSIIGTMSRTVTGQTTHEQGFPLWTFEEISNVTITFPDTTVAQADTFNVYLFVSDSQFVEYEDTVTTEYEIVIRLPVTVGDTWEPFSDSPSITREVMSVTENVSVPAGTYSNCLHTRDTDTEYPFEFFNAYYAPDIGGARLTIENQNPDQPGFVEMELTNVVIN